MYHIITKWSKKVVYTTTSRAHALYWLECNNEENMYELVKVKVNNAGQD